MRYDFPQSGTNYYPFLEEELLTREIKQLWNLFKEQQKAVKFLLLHKTNGQEDGQNLKKGEKDYEYRADYHKYDSR